MLDISVQIDWSNKVKRKLCNHNADFQRSITFQRDIEVWIKGELETVGKIKSFTDEKVTMADNSHLLRMNC